VFVDCGDSKRKNHQERFLRLLQTSFHVGFDYNGGMFMFFDRFIVENEKRAGKGTKITEKGTL
jgi:hypothetical protein